MLNTEQKPNAALITPRYRATYCRASLFSVGCTLLLLVSSAINAAPPELTPGDVLAPIDKPVYQPERTQTPNITRPEKKPAPAASQSSYKVRVNTFKFEGNTTYDDATLKKMVAEFEGKELSIADIYHVADVVEANYRYKGFLLTSVYVPAQKINSGTIILEVIEGRLGEVKIEGDLSSYSKGFLKKQVDGLQPGEIISDEELEKETLLLGDLPGLDARAIIAPGEKYGTSDVVFKTVEERYAGTITANNYGRKSIGEYRVEGGVLIANPIFEGDALNLSAILAQEGRMYYGRADYDALINTHGTKLGASVSLFKYNVDTADFDASVLGVDGSGSTFVVRASHPLQRTTKNNISLLADVRRSNTKSNTSASVPRAGTTEVSFDSTINLLELFLSWDHLYRDFARTAITGGLISNFKKRTDVSDRTSQRMKLTFDINHYQPVLETWFVTGRLQGVYSPDPLVDVERFRIGGQGSVRAYPSADVAGDRGAVISLEAGKNFQYASTVLTPKVFVDAGKVFRYRRPDRTEDATEVLSGYGAGLAAVFALKHQISLELVKPTSGKVSSDGRDARFWLNYRGAF